MATSRGQTEFDNLPREAIERAEVLPESVALQFGFSENQRVLNFVLREHRDGVDVLLAVAWRSPTVVGSGEPSASDTIYFSSLGTADLRVFLDLGHLSWIRGASWAQGARASLAVTNLFDRRLSVHDANGDTPTAFEPGFLDPLGRVLALTVRKVF